MAKHWVGQKLLSGFSIRCYGKTRVNFLTNSIQSSLYLFSSCIPEISEYVKKAPKILGVYVCNGVNFWVQRSIKRLFPSGTFEGYGGSGTILCCVGQSDALQNVRHPYLRPLNIRGSTHHPPSIVTEKTTSSNFQKHPNGESHCRH